MKTTIMNVIVVAALSFSGAALAAAETAGKVQTPAAPPAAPASAVPPAPAQAAQPAAKPLAPAKHAKAKKPRPKNLDLRHCLDLETDAAIAKCAGE
ncbi:hypothetical protein FGKAn22_20270 [Ferrigenium kumadai]|uniref:Uncharacterized protein n=1 Tax=Ferrigenium kumadai TaxID=1682490 RepID=A0AAN1T236_9PROT|nr:hypothetical protein [Ferrigenium kumadai]BBJ00335.1 hypothetical protein FGKAn22_20270 [Ferrigenium kumadai]